MSANPYRSAEVTGHSATKPPSFGSTLCSAASYFNLAQAATETIPPRSSPRLEKAVRTENPSKLHSTVRRMESLKQHKNLGLTGNIISATAHIPYVVGITQDDKFELTARQDKSIDHDCLSYLSSANTWNHTTVGWTGEILPTLSAEFGCLLKRRHPDTSSHRGSELGDVVARDVNDSGFKETFTQHVKDTEQAKPSTAITKAHRKELETLLQHVFSDTIIPVWLGEWSEDCEGSLILEDQARWARYAEGKLYNNLHSLHEPSSDGRSFEDYKRRNEAMADAIVKVYMPGDIIWVHDYQLMLLPEILRRKLPSAHIAYFHYTSWCPKEMLTKLREHEALMYGLLGASTIGVSRGHLRNYIADYYHHEMKLTNAENEIVDSVGRHISLAIVPTVRSVIRDQQAAFENEEIQAALSRISQTYKTKKLVVARAQSDHQNSIQFLLDSYKYFLDNYSDLARCVVFFLITSPLPTTDTVKSVYSNIVKEGVASRILAINNRFGSATHQPILYLNRDLADAEYLALLRSADVSVMTSDHEEIDAMSMEYIVCQRRLQNPLFISTCCLSNVGSGTDMIANCTLFRDVPTAAQKIREGLLMSENEKRNTHKAIHDYFTQQHVSTFTDDFLTKACASFVERVPFMAAPFLDECSLSKIYQAATKRLIMFDYDGTLTPIINDPDAAIPTERLLNSLQRLSANTAENQVWIISGRSRQFLERHFGHISSMGLSAEHGCFVRRPYSVEWDNLAAAMDMAWKHEVQKVFMDLEKDIVGSWIERKEVAMVWHYRNARDHDACLAKAVETKALLEVKSLKPWDVEIMLGKANVEVRPRFLNKGVMVADLVKEVFHEEERKFVLCAGDDTTDEGKNA